MVAVQQTARRRLLDVASRWSGRPPDRGPAVGPARGFVYVADNPRKDFIGARQLGWRTVRVRRDGGEHHRYEASVAEAADVEIASLRELPRLIVQMKG